MKELSKAAKLSENIRKTHPATSLSLSRRRLVYGVGVNDSDYAVGGGKGGCPAHKQWMGMLERCYSAKYLEMRPTYAGCSVDAEWISFMAFREWWVSHHVDGWQLDKDLISTGNKVYSKNTCVFVPSSINSFLSDHGSARGSCPIGVYFDKSRGNFVAQCSHGLGRSVTIGRFDSKLSAHLAWRRAKLDALEGMRNMMDDIDQRIYHTAKAKIMAHAQQ